MRLRVFLVVTAVALLSAGCPDGDDDPPTTTTSSGAVTTLPVSTTGAGATTTPTTSPTAAAVVLRPDGLGIVAIGATMDSTIAALDAAFGPVDESGTGCELAGPDVSTVRWDELRVQFVSGMFESYNVRPPPGQPAVLDLETDAGIGLGSTVAQLEDAYGLQLTIPGLPPEFGGENFKIVFGGIGPELYGTLSDTSAAGTVTAIFTQVCE